jgi:hypothetical protein
MKGIAILAAAAAMLSLACCNRLSANANASANAAANAAAPANQAAPQTTDAGKLNQGGAVPARSSGTVRLDRTYMIGRWTDDDNCEKSTTFDADGGYTDADGASGLWTLDGDRLTFTRNSTTVTFRVVPIDRNRITVIHDDGSLERSSRC